MFGEFVPCLIYMLRTYCSRDGKNILYYYWIEYTTLQWSLPYMQLRYLFFIRIQYFRPEKSMVGICVDINNNDMTHSIEMRKTVKQTGFRIYLCNAQFFYTCTRRII